MCVDYIGLNKACPKDSFPLPRINQIVDFTLGCETLCFLDAYSGYHQITMKEADRFEWTSKSQEVLDMVKLLLTRPPILLPPSDGESLLLYIVATTQVVNAALVVEREEEGHALKVQRPVYFISEVLSDSKTRYSQI